MVLKRRLKCFLCPAEIAEIAENLFEPDAVPLCRESLMSCFPLGL